MIRPQTTYKRILTQQCFYARAPAGSCLPQRRLVCCCLRGCVHLRAPAVRMRPVYSTANFTNNTLLIAVRVLDKWEKRPSPSMLGSDPATLRDRAPPPRRNTACTAPRLAPCHGRPRTSLLSLICVSCGRIKAKEKRGRETRQDTVGLRKMSKCSHISCQISGILAFAALPPCHPPLLVQTTATATATASCV